MVGLSDAYENFVSDSCPSGETIREVDGIHNDKQHHDTVDYIKGYFTEL